MDWTGRLVLIFHVCSLMLIFFYNVLVILFFFLHYWYVLQCKLYFTPISILDIIKLLGTAAPNTIIKTVALILYFTYILPCKQIYLVQLTLGISEKSTCWYTFLSPTQSPFFHLNTNQSTRSAYMPFREKKRLLLYIVNTIMKVYLYNTIFCIYISLVHVITRTFLQ